MAISLAATATTAVTSGTVAVLGFMTEVSDDNHPILASVAPHDIHQTATLCTVDIQPTIHLKRSDN